ncbi:MAG: site-specific DNA-methyltransferase, partial [Armatimonadetes bacterium]|nr:site-specific DNA-methyltransferase [Armatimonadota bacterium]
SKTRWPCKHDTNFWYPKHPDRYSFSYEAMDRMPYMAPGLAGPKNAQAWKTPTDVWWQTIVSPTGLEKAGYPNQSHCKSWSES